METSLHRELKQRYGGDNAQLEVPCGNYRIDAVVDDVLVEIQHGSLAAIRDKIRTLLKMKHSVLLVKPLIERKRLIKRAKKGGAVVDRRLSPKRGSLLDLFDELVYFGGVFPHQRLTLEVVMVEVEEWRYPGHGRRRRRRKGNFVVEDRCLVAIGQSLRLQTRADLWAMMPKRLPTPFHTGHLARRLGVERWVAQKIAYCLRETGTVRQVGKQGNTLLYQPSCRENTAA
ncbi:MAG: hypothetical protein N2C12_16490 [Planctomycetales bacterium]